MSFSNKIDDIFEDNLNDNKSQLKNNLKLKIKNKISLVKDKLKECESKIENYQNVYKYFKFKNQQIIEKLNNIYLDLNIQNKELGIRTK